MGKRVYNFNAGPAALPLEVLEQAKEEFVEYRGIGMSIMEISHRSKEYEALNDETQSLVRELLQVPDDYEVLFLQGGASTQFAMVPMNFLPPGQTAAYIVSGSWAKKALKEADTVGKTFVAAQEEAFTKVPVLKRSGWRDDTAYVHLTSNETIEGIQYQTFPNTGNTPLVADMSSDIMCRPVDISQFDLIYAGAQKNLGPSGVTLVILKKSFLEQAVDKAPVMFRYKTHADAKSLYNTPPVYSVYMVNKVLHWIKNKGGLAGMEQFNRKKTNLIYEAIDLSGGFYQGTVEKESRSIMNIPFRLQSEALEKQFLAESAEHGFIGLKGHRSVGGLRASTYNAVPHESCQALSEFMRDFQQRNG